MNAATQNEMERLVRVNREQQALLDQIHQYVDEQGLAKLGQSRVKALIEAHKRAEAESGALAAHVEFCHKVLSMIENGPDYLVARQYRALRMARERKPENSLARLKAQWQADAVSTFALHHLGGHEQEVAEIYASRLRQQAEENTQ